MASKKSPPEFSAKLLHPKYWLTWLWMAFLYLVSWLPYRLQMALGTALGWLFYKTNSSRVKIARKNYQISFPEWSIEKVEKMTKTNMVNTGIAIFETGMAWFWPDWRLRKHAGEVVGLDILEKARAEGKRIYLLAFHFLTMEISGRVFSQHERPVSFYRPHDNPVIDLCMFKGRSRANKDLIPKQNVRGFMRAVKKHGVSIYLPDQDYGPRNCLFVPFMAQDKVATTLGTLAFAKHADTVIVSSYCYRDNKTGKYITVLRDGLDSIPSDSPEADLTLINQHVEHAVRDQPGEYLWAHRRYKTRPNNEPSLYK